METESNCYTCENYGRNSYCDYYCKYIGYQKLKSNCDGYCRYIDWDDIYESGGVDDVIGGYFNRGENNGL